MNEITRPESGYKGLEFTDEKYIKVFFPQSSQKLSGVKQIFFKDLGHQTHIVIHGTHDKIKYKLDVFTNSKEEKIILMNDNNKILGRY